MFEILLAYMGSVMLGVAWGVLVSAAFLVFVAAVTYLISEVMK